MLGELVFIVFFRDYAVTTANAISTGSSAGIVFVNPLSVFLSGLGQITHIINGKGNTVNTSGQTEYVC